MELDIETPETAEDFQKAWDAEAGAAEGDSETDLNAEASDELQALADELSAPVEDPEAEADEEPDHEAEEEDAPEAEAEADDPEKEEKEAAESGMSPKAAKLVEELKKLGYDVDGRQVVPQERKHFREKVRKEFAKVEEHKVASLRDLEQTGRAIEERFAPYQELAEAVKSQEMDKVASMLSKMADLGEAKTWLDFNKNHFNRLQSPAYQEQMKLKRQLEEERAERQAAIAEQQRLREEDKRAQARASWRDDVTDQLETSDDKLVVAFAGDETFIEQVLHIQETEYRRSGTVPTAEQAAALVIPGARAMYDKLSKIFGAQTTSSSEKPDSVANAGEPIRGPNSGKKGGGNPKKSVSQRKATEASGKHGDYIPEEEWMEEAIRGLKEANKSA